jgi:hypothetical protein
MLLSIWYQMVRWLLGLTVVLIRRDLSKDAELLVLRRENVWVPNWSSRSCDLGVFVDQSTEPIAASDAERGR